LTGATASGSSGALGQVSFPRSSRGQRMEIATRMATRSKTTSATSSLGDIQRGLPEHASCHCEHHVPVRPPRSCALRNAELAIAKRNSFACAAHSRRAFREAALSHCGKSLGLDVLVVDDDKNIRATLRVCLEALGCKLVEAANGAGVRAALGLGRFDLAFVDVRLGREDGLDLLPTLLAIDPPVDVIVISAHADIDSAVRAMKLGASGFVPKPFSREQIETIAEKVAHERAVRRRIAERRRKLDESAPEIDLQTQSPKMQRALDVAARAAPHRAPVLLRGERGTGKAVLARRIHALSTFAAGPFMAVRCATVD
jgi:FixJ family two-component response regulator